MLKTGCVTSVGWIDSTYQTVKQQGSLETAFWEDPQNEF
jgi:hypothetical protein